MQDILDSFLESKTWSRVFYLIFIALGIFAGGYLTIAGTIMLVLIVAAISYLALNLIEPRVSYALILIGLIYMCVGVIIRGVISNSHYFFK